MAAAAAPAEGEGFLAFLARPDARPPEDGGRRHGVGRLGSRVLGTERPTEGRGESVGG